MFQEKLNQIIAEGKENFNPNVVIGDNRFTLQGKLSNAGTEGRYRVDNGDSDSTCQFDAKEVKDIEWVSNRYEISLCNYFLWDSARTKDMP